MSVRTAVMSSLVALSALGAMGCAGAQPVNRTQGSAPDEALAVRAPISEAAVGPTVEIGELERAFEVAAGRIAPSVVSVTSERDLEGEVPAFLRSFGGPEGPIRGMGSGVIIDERGHILTNNHVVDGAELLLVELADDREVEAVVVGSDPKTDLAIIRVDADGLTPAAFGDSASVRVGQWVLAAGSPFGLPRTVTAGIVSAMGRGSMGIADYGDFIQTDAAVNQGNSGGPLIDLHGRVIGINTAIASHDGGSNGIGFAIPGNLARSVAVQLLEHGYVARGWLGIVMAELTPDLASSFDYAGTSGVLIDDLDPKGPAAKAGIEIGDIISHLDERAISDMADFRNTIAGLRPGTQVELSVWRDGRVVDLVVELGSLEDELPPRRLAQASDPNDANEGPLQHGLQLQDPSVRQRLERGIAPGRGAVVARIERDSVAHGSELEPGDVILQIEDKPVRSAKQAERLLARSNLQSGVRLRIQRGPFGHFVILKD